MLWIPVVFLVGDHWISGLVSHEGRRLQEILNDKTSEYLTIHEVRLYLSMEMTEPVAQLPRATVPKANVIVAMLADDTHENPRRRAASFVRKDTYLVYLTIPRMEIKGHVHLTQRSDPGTFLVRLAKEGTSFFPVTQSTVSAVGPLAEPTEAAVTLVNRAHVDLIYLSETPTIL